MGTVLESNITHNQHSTAARTVEVPRENIKRSVLKTISWRIVGTTDTIVVSYIITGTLALAFSIGAIELVSKMGLYFVHERAWNTIKWGK